MVIRVSAGVIEAGWARAYPFLVIGTAWSGPEIRRTAMNKFLTLAVLSTTLVLGAVSAEAAATRPAVASAQTVVEGRNMTESFAAQNGAAAIREQAEGNMRSTH